MKYGETETLQRLLGEEDEVEPDHNRAAKLCTVGAPDYEFRRETRNLARCYLSAMARLKIEERKADALAEEVILAGQNLRIKHNLVLDAEERVRELETRIGDMRG